MIACNIEGLYESWDSDGESLKDFNELLNIQ
jgi:hypothetical protein